MRSPVSQGSSGERNAITCRVSSNSELVFVSTLGLPARSGILYGLAIEGPRPQLRGTLRRLGEDVSRRDRNSSLGEKFASIAWRNRICPLLDRRLRE
jgi:hypothetical protein